MDANITGRLNGRVTGPLLVLALLAAALVGATARAGPSDHEGTVVEWNEHASTR